MPFDDNTRGRLQSFVGSVRDLLSEEFAWQLQQNYGMDPSSGAVAELDRLSHLDDQRLETARILRDIMEHYLGIVVNPSVKERQQVLDRIVREQAFTVLNRLAALRMMEARGILLESVAKGYQSKAFQLYSRVAGTALGETGDTYRVFLFGLYDMFTADLPALFDRHSPFGRLFPREATFLRLLDLVNAPDLEPMWGEDETIGWIYQYFNSAEERKRMRKESGAPRSSRELAVRNQFFTPRYVVEFLVDNTLGRQWFDQMAGRTSLTERCRYMLYKPEELHQELVPRPRDPRTIKLLDPACGSMHFGLYAFDIFEVIYREAWSVEQQCGPGSLTGADDLEPLSSLYSDEQSFLRDVPKLIIERNIWGVDIDPRAAQIASLALWLRAQRAWNEAGVSMAQRGEVGRGNIVAALAPPGDRDELERFSSALDRPDAQLFEGTLKILKHLPEMGLLLKVENSISELVRSVYGHHGPMFREQDLLKWQEAKDRLNESLAKFAKSSDLGYRNSLFATDAIETLRIIQIMQRKFDVVVMNPPFGAPSKGTKPLLAHDYRVSKNDLLAAFVERALDLVRPGGRVGAITSRACFFLTTFRSWRQEILLKRSSPETVVDLGLGVMDDAMVEAAAYVLERSR